MFRSLNGSSRSLDPLMANIAKSITGNMRMQPDAGPLITGDAWTYQTSVLIVWAWMILPLTVSIAALVFLIAVAILSQIREMPKWKDQSLATLFYGLDDETLRETRVLRKDLELEDVDIAKDLFVRIRRYEDTWGLRRTRFKEKAWHG